MSSARNYRPVALLRWLLLGALALFLGGVVAVFWSNTLGVETKSEPVSRDSLGLNLARDILSGKGFEYEVAEGAEKLYHIRASRILANRDNVVTLEGIVLEIARESGESYKIAASRGVYRSDNGTAEVEGDVILSGPGGVEMRGPKFELLRKGTLVKSVGPVEFTGGAGLTGSANEVEAYLKKDRFQLAGQVQLSKQGEGLEGDLTLAARKVVYDKKLNMVHAEGGVRLRRGRDEMSCGRLAVTLAEDGDGGASGPRFVRARSSVSGTMISHDDRGFDRRMRFSGEQVSIAYAKRNGEPKDAELVGTAAAPAWLESGDDAGLVRRFASRRLDAGFARGQIKQIRTDGVMMLTEFLTLAPARELGRICGGLAVATFDRDGDLIEMAMRRGADLHRPGLQVFGETLTASSKEVIKVLGEPAHILTRQGQLSAPDMTFSGARGDLVASGGVRAWLPAASGLTILDTADSTADLPIQVTATSAEWGQAQGRFQFDGKVRAWQGESFLTAERLIGENGGRIRGSGGIQTTLERAPKADLDRESEPESPVRVTADSFEYTESDDLIEYLGSPEVRDAGRVMSCDKLSVYLRKDSDLDRLECSGNALIDDRPSGQKVTGTDAIYRPDASKVEVSGSPVTLQKPDGTVVRAGRVIYDFETSIAQFLSASSAAAAEGEPRQVPKASELP